MQFDRADLKILAALQEDASQSVMEIAEAVNLSHNACWRRMKRLEESGVVRRTVALLDPKKVGLNLTVLVSVRTNDHSAEWTQRFADMVGRMPEVVEL